MQPRDLQDFEDSTGYDLMQSFFEDSNNKTAVLNFIYQRARAGRNESWNMLKFCGIRDFRLQRTKPTDLKLFDLESLKDNFCAQYGLAKDSPENEFIAKMAKAIHNSLLILYCSSTDESFAIEDNLLLACLNTLINYYKFFGSETAKTMISNLPPSAQYTFEMKFVSRHEAFTTNSDAIPDFNDLIPSYVGLLNKFPADRIFNLVTPEKRTILEQLEITGSQQVVLPSQDTLPTITSITEHPPTPPIPPIQSTPSTPMPSTQPSEMEKDEKKETTPLQGVSDISHQLFSSPRETARTEISETTADQSNRSESVKIAALVLLGISLTAAFASFTVAISKLSEIGLEASLKSTAFLSLAATSAIFLIASAILAFIAALIQRIHNRNPRTQQNI
ncbi:MAG: hypothetical protein LBJ93_01310 [Clostridiales bacterium]|jgi:hypothetical protein|nr:hypothetical protein [Clostridiales bacterium]